MRGSDFGRVASGRARPFVMGILNVTPDSFSDGGMYADADAAVKHAFDMIDAGADIIDVGAESTRPGFTPVDPSDELRRLIPVIRRIAESSDVAISVDTMKADTARAAVSAGAHMINDVNAFRGEGMVDYASESQVPVIIMHMNGTPLDTHLRTMGDPVIPRIMDFFHERMTQMESAGVRHDNMILDPGVGFGKSMEQNAEIIMNADRLVSDAPLLMAASRKRVLEHMFPGMDRDEATAKVSAISAEKGADIVRVHDVAGTIRAFQNMNL